VPSETADRKPDSEKTSSTQANQGHSVEFRREKVVLIVDDDILCAELATKYLQKANIKSKMVHHGKAAVEEIKRNHGDIKLILMDCEMPQMDGWEATQLINGFLKENGLESIPVFGLTGHVGEEYFKKCRDAGMTKVLTKPVHFMDLVEMVKDVLG